MSQIEAVFFDCDGTLVDSEVICSRAYVSMFQAFGITLDLEEIFKRFKGVKLYEIIDIINEEHGVELAKADLEPVYRAEVARLFDTELEVIAGANALLDSMAVPMCVVSNGPVSKMQHSLGKLGMLHHFPDLLFSGYDIQRWKPDCEELVAVEFRRASRNRRWRRWGPRRVRLIRGIRSRMISTMAPTWLRPACTSAWLFYAKSTAYFPCRFS